MRFRETRTHKNLMGRGVRGHRTSQTLSPPFPFDRWYRTCATWTRGREGACAVDPATIRDLIHTSNAVRDAGQGLRRLSRDALARLDDAHSSLPTFRSDTRLIPASPSP